MDGRLNRDAATVAAAGAAPTPHHPVVVEHAARRAADVQLRVADAITGFAGSMPFVYIHAAAFACWMLFVESDPWPRLTLIVSLEAIFLSTFVMIGQNRQAEFQRAKADHDFATEAQELRANTELTREIHTLTTEIHRHVHGEQPPDDARPQDWSPPMTDTDMSPIIERGAVAPRGRLVAGAQHARCRCLRRHRGDPDPGSGPWRPRCLPGRRPLGSSGSAPPPRWRSSADLRGRRSAINGVAAMAVSSAVVNLALKPLSDRRRPDRTLHQVPTRPPRVDADLDLVPLRPRRVGSRLRHRRGAVAFPEAGIPV